MRRIIRALRLPGAALFAALAVACTDRVPTLTDADRLSPDLVPTTIEVLLDANQFLTSAVSIRGDTDITDSNDLVVANDFDGALSAHVLATFPEVPDTVHYSGSVDSQFTIAEAWFVSAVPDTLAVTRPQVSFYLWTIEEEWDTTATWTEASSIPTSRPWQEPGGTRGELLAVATWPHSVESNEGAAKDSLLWEIPPSRLIEFKENPPHGLMVTIENTSARAEISPLALRLSIALSQADTTVTRTIFPDHQTYVLTPDPPAPTTEMSVGGLTSDRVLLRLQLPTELPGCPAGAPPCEPIPASEVTLNRVDLVFDPVPVPFGFRPVAPLPISVRQRFEPELGLRAPLGPVFSVGTATSEQFEPGGKPVHFVITAAVGTAFRRKETDLGLGLSVEPEASTISYAWFDPNPRLRIIYTLPQTPPLP